MVDSAQATEKRECSPDGKVQSFTDSKFPVHCSNRGSAGPSEEVATPATECEVELLEGRRIISNKLETEGGPRENIGDETRRREGKRETFTKAPSAGLVKETIPVRADNVDVRAPRKGGRKDNAEIPVLLDQGQGNAAKVHTAVRAAQRTKDHSCGLGGADTKGEAPANTPSTASRAT